MYRILYKTQKRTLIILVVIAVTLYAMLKKNNYQIYIHILKNFGQHYPDHLGKSCQMYGRLTDESEKDRLLAQWAQLVETELRFQDVRAASRAVDAVAGEAIS